jgi:hypothetical protein
MMATPTLASPRHCRTASENAMQLLPENTRRRENVVAGLAAAFAVVAMIAIAGEASATDPAPSHAAHHHAAPATNAPASAPANAKKVDERKPAQEHPASHHDHGTSHPAAQEESDQQPAPEPKR